MPWEPDYATVEELRAYVRVLDEDDDAQLALAVTTASRAIDRTCRRQFGKVAEAEDRYYTARWDHARQRWVVPIDDLADTAEMTVEFDENGDGSYSSTVAVVGLRPVNAVANGRPYEELVVHPSNEVQLSELEAGVRVHAQFGWTTVPTAIKQACLLQASRLLARRDSPYGVAGSPEAGSEVRLLARVDPDVEVALAPYKRSRWVFA